MGCCLFDCIGGVILAIFRWTLFVLNIIFILAGGTVVTIGTLIYINTEEWNEIYNEITQIASIVCMAAGSMTVLVACFGIFAVLKKSPWAMFTYTGLMLATFACLLAGGICTYAYKEHFVEQAQENMVELMKRYPAPSAGGDLFAKDTWDRLQSEYRCCGITAFGDWTTNRPELGGYPDSCLCESGSAGCSAEGNQFLFDQGCFTKVQLHTVDLVEAQGGTAISAACLQFIAVVLSLCLANSFRKRNRSMDVV